MENQLLTEKERYQNLYEEHALQNAGMGWPGIVQPSGVGRARP
jgi:hypothetical protein